MKQTDRSRALARLKREFAQAYPAVAEDRYVRCPRCGQFYDVRDFTEVYYHDDRPHQPMKTDA